MQDINVYCDLMRISLINVEFLFGRIYANFHHFPKMKTVSRYIRADSLKENEFIPSCYHLTYLNIDQKLPLSV